MFQQKEDEVCILTKNSVLKNVSILIDSGASHLRPKGTHMNNVILDLTNSGGRELKS